MSTDKIRQTLKAIYYSPGGAASFAGISAVHAEAEKRLRKKIPRKLVEQWLEQQYTYIRHKKIKKPKGKRRLSIPIVTSNINQRVDCDLAHFPKTRRPYALVCTDLFSGKIWAEPMVKKTAQSTAKAMQKILDESGPPIESIRTDYGSEFKQQYQSLLKKQNIKHKFTESQQKAGAAEGAINRLSSRLARP